MPSIEFSEFKEQIDYLINKIPERIPDRDFDKEDIIAYQYSVVLIHSEFEHYFESRAIGIMREAIRCYEISNEIKLPLLSVAIKSENNKHRSEELILDAIKKLAGDYISKVTGHNHGIKKENIVFIYKNIGASFIHDETLDDIFFNDLKWLAEQRGMAAHRSYNYVVEKGISPSDLKNKVTQLLSFVTRIEIELETEFAI